MIAALASKLALPLAANQLPNLLSKRRSPQQSSKDDVWIIALVAFGVGFFIGGNSNKQRPKMSARKIQQETGKEKENG